MTFNSLEKWTLISTTAADTTLPRSLGRSTAVIANDYIFIIGGIDVLNATTPDQDNVYSTKIIDGKIDTWRSTEKLKNPEPMPQIITNGRYMFHLSYIDKINSSKILTNGAIDPWVEQRSLNINVWGSSVVNSGDYIYVIGGFNNSEIVDTVYMAQIDNATIKDWTPTSSLPIPISNACVVTSGKYIYIIGGLTRSTRNPTKGKYSQKVYSAEIIPADGTLMPWKELSIDNLFPTIFGYASAVTSGNSIFVTGIYNGTIVLDIVYSAEINGDGTLQKWRNLSAITSNVLPAPFSNAALVTDDNYIYILGGRLLKTVYSAKLISFDFTAQDSADQQSTNIVETDVETDIEPKPIPIKQTIDKDTFSVGLIISIIGMIIGIIIFSIGIILEIINKSK